VPGNTQGLGRPALEVAAPAGEGAGVNAAGAAKGDEGDAGVVELVEQGADFGFVRDPAGLGQVPRGHPGAEEYDWRVGGGPPALVEGLLRADDRWQRRRPGCRLLADEITQQQQAPVLYLGAAQRLSHARRGRPAEPA
jgi:hypothetical protein